MAILSVDLPTGAPLPSNPEKRTCAVCGAPLSTYNLDTVCLSKRAHTPEQMALYRAMQGEAKKAKGKANRPEKFDRAVWETRIAELPRVAEARLILALTIAANNAHESNVMDLGGKLKMKKGKPTREMVAYLLIKKLQYSWKELATFFGYKRAWTSQVSLRDMADIESDQARLELVRTIEEQFDQAK